MGDTPILATPGGVTGIGDTWVGAGWRAERATSAEDPWGAAAPDTLPPGITLPTGVGLTGSGGISVAGLQWLGHRAYDPATRGFLTVGPLDAVTGAGWSGNPYSCAGNDPLHALDPTGLRPVTDADLRAYRDGNNGAFAAAGHWWSNTWEYVAAGAMVVAGVALMFTGVGTLAGMALVGAASGAFLAGGISVATQKATTGERARFGARQFVVHRPDPDRSAGLAETIRVIELTQDSRWTFHTYGDPLPFEEVSAYTNRRIADRFTPEMLADYCATYGLHPFDDDFFPGPSYILEQVHKAKQIAEPETFAQAQARLGIVPRGNDQEESTP
ncbi:hypothetical protein [Rathayibacter tanaceti]|uniref:RHS repeat-associated protein n=2 Tax=Rathayibacter tanaceti TaxID=1671680 RepID=A0AAE6V6U6_9MICO|nr:hypothetical protein [Rathayibacter tanaceti]QHC56602.1 hypothetical protein GSU10_13845 [Rathayibacter tanaceti]